ncbi:hypothetical protein UFOVP276_35 [uncultured Caudovirales phage]|uniref:Uncharacterized protein n=1 Tax=uncultured Caudovirales phage TaxID=2100421 RepID=A0A6J5LEU5_9CAUD|nr:hypothetical protein UFOVP127_172 [uncultured Caudovirales phage]CAB4134951.1 hypothetical protein UFOVP276_35 [uncultured Caudovirales phage]
MLDATMAKSLSKENNERINNERINKERARTYELIDSVMLQIETDILSATNLGDTYIRFYPMQHTENDTSIQATLYKAIHTKLTALGYFVGQTKANYSFIIKWS